MKVTQSVIAVLLSLLLLPGCTPANDPPVSVSVSEIHHSGRSSLTAASSDPLSENNECRLDCRKPGDGGHIGVWWWNAADGIGEKKRGKYLDFLAQNGVDEIYFCPGNYSNEKVQIFVADANARGMRVAWLTGDSGWLEIDSTGCQIAVDRFLTYQKTAPADARFYAIHLDVEPHQRPDFSSARPGYMQRFYEIADEAGKTVHAGGYEIEWDLPFWFDQDKVFTIDAGEILFLEAMSRISDTLCLMSYRDKAADILSISEEELAAAANTDCRVVCGVETHSEEGDGVSFMEEGKRKMYAELVTLYRTLSGKEKAYGIAVHYLNTWYDLPE